MLELELSSDAIRYFTDCTQHETTTSTEQNCQALSIGEELVDQERISIPLLELSKVSYGMFFEEYLLKNRPCLFSETITADWLSIKDWVIHSEPGTESDGGTKINFEFLRKQYGTAEVSVANCDNSLLEYGSEDTQPMSLNAFIDYWTSYIAKGHPASMPCLYLKDWHIVNDSKDYEAYTTPKYFQSDWLNEAWETDSDDFRFAYLGPRGSWTPFHCDVYGSFSWSANIIGTKKWYIYPPGKEKDFLGLNGRIKFDYSNPGKKNVDFYEVVQKAGQIIFVPSGWYHIVWNLEDTISINHNWMNGANICYIWSTLKAALADVKKEIQDLQHIEEFSEQCQLILKANHGMNYLAFFNILLLIMKNRKSKIRHMTSNFGQNHVNFDLASIYHTLHNHLQPDIEASDLWKKHEDVIGCLESVVNGDWP